MFADEVMLEFKSAEPERQAAKDAELAPYVEAAFERKQFMAELDDGEIPTYAAYGHTIAEVDIESLPEAQRRRVLQMRRLRDVVREADERAEAAAD